MPDIKFGDNIIAKKYTKSSHYFDVAREAVKEMYRQVGDLQVDYPAHKSYAFSELSRGITRYEYAQAVEQAQQFGLTRLITSSELNF
jgi:uncharacterized Fe-S radical SAM superfamily protein PflX